MVQLGTVYLRVANLDKQIAFYQKVIGLHVQREEGDTVYLGAGGDDLLALIHTPEGKRIHGHNGLYHFAILLPTRADLARTLRHFALTETPLQGLSDHLVSEAIYLADPEGNGIEVYADRPRTTWYRNGQLQMDTIPINIADLMREQGEVGDGPHRLPAGTVIGHVHLHVSDLAAATNFYREVLGMDVLFHMPSASFLSYEGYHHHLGINTWAGRVSREANALGLDHFTLKLNDEAQAASILARLANSPQAQQLTDTRWQVFGSEVDVLVRPVFT
ncbi:MAG: VOC family protein [Anaerolineae bacterium]